MSKKSVGKWKRVPRNKKVRRLQGNDSDKSLSEQETLSSKTSSYGTAYELKYDGGFYYGDLREKQGALPDCFENDNQCREKSSSRDNMAALLGLGILVLVAIIVIIVCSCTKKSKHVAEATLNGTPDG